MKELILKQLCNNKAVEDLRLGELSVSSPIQEAMVLAASFYQNKRIIVVVKPNLYAAQRLQERLIPYLSSEECCLFSVEDSLRVEAIASSPELLAGRVELMHQFLDGKSRIIITHVSALIRQLPRPELFKDRCLTLSLGQEIEPNELKRNLIRAGYHQLSHVDQPLSFAVRGGVFDVYSMNYDHPIRIEFFDREIERLCFFDIQSQRSIENISQVEFIPATDILFSEEDIEVIKQKANELLSDRKNNMSHEVEMDLQLIENYISNPSLYLYYPFTNKTASVLDYLNQPEIILSSKEECEIQVRHVTESNVAYIQEMVQEGKKLPRFSVMNEFENVINGYTTHEVNLFMDNTSGILELDLPKETLAVQLRLLEKTRKDHRILFCLQEHEMKVVTEECIKQSIPYSLVQIENELKVGVNLAFTSIFEGFHSPKDKLMVIGSNDIYGKAKKSYRFANKFKNAEMLQSYQDLNIQDYVVHNQHGVGQYMGIETKEVVGIRQDFLRIIYRGNDELLVPLEQFRLVRKFLSKEGAQPKLHKLGSSEWRKTKERVQDSVNDLAERLVNLYALRTQEGGYAFDVDSEAQLEFEKSFDYELTPDQKVAVEEIKKDMMTKRPMDRLLCGDVGFGKTEVAIRAAFKAVHEGKQVAFLCPTTILSSQHVKTFKQRFGEEAVVIEVLNRFVSVSKQREILKRCKEGKIDILIGTHRMLSKDVQFRDLGLLVIDEEQRFGVEHKEKISEMKQSVDVLSLSATPIPRTLQMSLLGIRQLSLLETPPDNRQSVQTYIVEKKDGLVKEVIERELSRQGQVFYLHNHTEEIYQRQRQLQALLPLAKMATVHGKMDRDEVEDVMMKFSQGELDILLCTTIIETGIDIPNANTILVENAQNFGLSQLYQIKGRVGRSSRLAYAYFMIPEARQLTEAASKRLQAMKDFTQLGSGYKIAMRDLTIRGAGDILGPEQSGFIDTVGMDMYLEMLEEAINDKKGIVKREEKAREKIKAQADNYIPKEYAADDYDKLSMYQKIDEVKTEVDLLSYQEQIRDEHGRLPQGVETIFKKRWLEILLSETEKIKLKDEKQYELIFSEEFSNQLDGIKLFEMINQLSKEITLKYQQGEIKLTVPKRKDALEMMIEIIKRKEEVIRSES
ncbi:MAG: transcription-repair coupling factor [Anaerorhabdus sp.]